MRTTPVDKTQGLRERNKQQKRRRIYLVARKLFEKQGYDSTTMRQIARAADVGEGTVFLYARDKRELLFRIFKDDLTAVFDEAFRQVPRDARFLEQLLALLTPVLRFLQPHGALARIMVRETFNLTGPAAEESAELRAGISAKFTHLLREAQQRAEIRADRTIPQLIEAIWASFRFYMDDWLGERKPALADGVTRMRIGLALLFEGIATESAACHSREQSASSSH
jgi:AcrR family transcriptional regulator